MRAIGIKELKNKLSEYVRLAAAGERILVTSRDRVVAELVAPQETHHPMLADAMLADAVREGWVVPPLCRSDDPPPRMPVAPLEKVLEGLETDRDER